MDSIPKRLRRLISSLTRLGMSLLALGCSNVSVTAATQELPGSDAELDSTLRTDAIHYVRTFDQDTKILVWPNRNRFYEVNGVAPVEFQEVVDSFNSAFTGLVEMVRYEAFPLISINFYRSSESQPNAQFAYKSRMQSNYKEYISNLDFSGIPCAFTLSSDREIWAAQAAVFIDLDQLSGDRLEECMEVALYYVNGFPVERSVNFDGVPDDAIRFLVLNSVLNCSYYGRDESKGHERSRDGFTALPSIDCVLRDLYLN